MNVIVLLMLAGCPFAGTSEDAGQQDSRCVTDDDCGTGERCQNNRCSEIPFLCSVNADCSEGLVCEDGNCLEPCSIQNECTDSGSSTSVDAGSHENSDGGNRADSGSPTNVDGGDTAAPDASIMPPMDAGMSTDLDSGNISSEDSGISQQDGGSWTEDAGSSGWMDAGSPADSGQPQDAGALPDGGNIQMPFSSQSCEMPVTYERIGHTGGNVNFQRVSWSPDSEYALVIGYPAKLFRFDPSTDSLTLIGEASGEQWNVVRFSEDGQFALIAGNVTGDSSSPVLYRYTTAGGFEALATNGLFGGTRIQDIQPRPGSDSFGVLSDNGYGWNPMSTTSLGYAHEITIPESAADDLSTTYFGATNISQGASSFSWGKNLGSQIALAVSRYLELMYLDPALSSSTFSLQSHGNVGNLKKVIFHPDGEQAWILQWSGQGRVYAWEGSLHTDDDFGFTGWSMWDFSITEDGHWKIFVGRNGNIWFSDSPFRPITSNMFYNHPIPGFSNSPWSGDSNTYLHEAAFRPGKCEGLIVGDATQNQGLLIRFNLQEK